MPKDKETSDKSECRHGNEMTSESKAEWEQSFKDIEDCFNNLEVIDEEDEE